jgi:putative oxidoreductase
MTTTAAQGAGGAAPSKGLNIGLWVVQGLLGLAFTMAGVMKSTQPIAALAEKMIWPGVVPEALVRFIGVSELLGGLGLILPAATRIKPGLTPLAAAGLATVMVLAAIFHVSRGEFGGLPVNFVMGGLMAFVAWGRFKKAPITPR